MQLVEMGRVLVHFKTTSRPMVMFAYTIQIWIRIIMCDATCKNVKRLCTATSLMRPRWMFCRTLAATCLFNLLTAWTQKSLAVHRSNPIHRHCYPMSKHLFIVANSGSSTDILITSEMILLDVIFQHRFCSSLKWKVSCSCLLANKNTEGSSHYWGDLSSCQSERPSPAVFTSQCKVIVSSMN